MRSDERVGNLRNFRPSSYRALQSAVVHRAKGYKIPAANSADIPYGGSAKRRHTVRGRSVGLDPFSEGRRADATVRRPLAEIEDYIEDCVLDQMEKAGLWMLAWAHQDQATQLRLAKETLALVSSMRTTTA